MGGSLEVVKILIAAGADENRTTTHRQLSYVSALYYFLNMFVILDQTCDYYWYPFHIKLQREKPIDSARISGEDFAHLRRGCQSVVAFLV